MLTWSSFSLSRGNKFPCTSAFYYIIRRGCRVLECGLLQLLFGGLMVRNVCQLPCFAGDVKTFVISDSRTQYSFAPLLHAGTMFRSSFVSDLCKFALYKVLCFVERTFPFTSISFVKIQQFYLTFINEHLDFNYMRA